MTEVEPSVPRAPQVPSAPVMDRRAAASLLVAIGALVVPLALVCVQPLIAALLQLAGGLFAVVAGLRGRKAALESAGRYTGEGAAMGGVIIGAMVLLLGVLDFAVGVALATKSLS